MSVIFETVHGSHLYGLNHAESDLDIYQVIGFSAAEMNRKTKQTIVNNEDRIVVSYARFMRLCENGNPQALEAMFSQKASKDLISNVRSAFRIDLSCTSRVYLRTIKNFANGGAKQRTHALRLIRNLNEMWDKGYFNPTLSPEDALEFRVISKSIEYTKYLRSLSKLEFDLHDEDIIERIKKEGW